MLTNEFLMILKDYQSIPCVDQAFDCSLKASLGQCEVILTDGKKVKEFCPRSCANCNSLGVNVLTCASLTKSCNTGYCSTSLYFSIPSVTCVCPPSTSGE